MSSQHLHLIELFGQPGSGKSTVSRALGSEWFRTRSAMGEAWRRDALSRKAMAGFSAACDFSFLGSTFRLVSSAGLFHKDSLTRLARLAVKAEWLDRNSGPLMIEEGHLQDLWSILYSAHSYDPKPEVLAPLIQHLYRDIDATIAFLDVGPDEVSDRISRRERGKSRLDRMTAERRRFVAHATSELSRRIADGARMAGLDVQRVEATGSIDDSTSALRSIIDAARTQSSATRG